MVKSANDSFRARLARLIARMWVSPPSSWEASCKQALVKLLYKRRGSMHDLHNWRGIFLVSICSRIIARVVATRLTEWSEREGIIVPEQAGFRPYRCMLDVLFLIRLLVKLATRVTALIAQQRFALVLLDLIKAYPNTSRNACWAVLRMYGVPEGVMSVIRGLHETTVYEVDMRLGRSRPYALERGVREGCPSSCVIFSIYHSWVMTQVKARITDVLGELGSGITVQSHIAQCHDEPLHNSTVSVRRRCMAQRPSTHIERLLSVLFADGTTMLAQEGKRVEVEAITAEVMRDWGESINPGKTGRLRLDHPCVDPGRLPGDTVELRDAIKLLGGRFESTGGLATDSAQRNAAARAAWGKLHKTLQYSGLSARQKGRIVSAVVEGTLLYGCQCRPFPATEIRQYQSFMNRVVRGICLFVAPGSAT